MKKVYNKNDQIGKKETNQNKVETKNSLNFSETIRNYKPRERTEQDIIRDRERFLDEIENNDKFLNNLPIEKLEVLNDYYDFSINYNIKKLKKLKSYND